MGSIFLENTTTNDVTRFFIDTVHPSLNDNVHTLPPGSYKVIKNTISKVNLYRFDGLFQILEPTGLVTVTSQPLRKYAYFNLVEPNFLVIPSSPPNGAHTPITLKYTGRPQ